MSNQLSSVVTSPLLYLNGLQLSYATTTTLNIAAGQCRDSNNMVDMFLYTSSAVPSGMGYVSAPLTLTLSTIGLNGLDAAVVASSCYDVYLIAASDNSQQIGCIATLDVNSAPVMPFGYDTLRKIGFFSTNSSSLIIQFWQTGDLNFRYNLFDAPVATAITAGASTTFAPCDLVGLVPRVTNLRVDIQYNLTANAAGDAVYLQGFNQTGALEFISQSSTAHLLNVATISSQINVSNGHPEINYKVTSGSDAVALNVSGFAYYI